MLQQVTTNRPIYFNNNANYPMQGLKQQAIDNVPIADKIVSGDQHELDQLGAMIVGGWSGNTFGKMIDPLTLPNGPVVHLANKISNKTVKFDQWADKVQIGSKSKGFIDSILSKLFKQESIDTFKKGFHSNSYKNVALKSLDQAGNALAKANQAQSLLTKVKDQLAACTDANVAKTLAKRVKKLEKLFRNAQSNLKNAPKNSAAALNTLETMNQLSTMGRLGKLTGKIGLFLKNNLIGTQGLFNGVFAAMTLVNTFKAKKDEKFSTFMEEVMGTWVGSMGGFRLTEKLLKGATDIARSNQTGSLAFMCKIINKIPAKKFVVPLIGAMILSSFLMKISHTLFGKPTKPEEANAEAPGSMQEWLTKTGWTPEALAEVQKAHQAEIAKNPAPKAAQLNEGSTKSSEYTGYMPAEKPPVNFDDIQLASVAGVDSRINQTLKNINNIGLHN